MKQSNHFGQDITKGFENQLKLELAANCGKMLVRLSQDWFCDRFVLISPYVHYVHELTFYLAEITGPQLFHSCLKFLLRLSMPIPFK